MTFNYRKADKATVPCPLCRGGDFVLLASVDRYGMGLKTVGCSACGLVQTNPRLTPSANADFYEHSYRAFYQGVQRPDAAYVKAQKKDDRLRATVAHLLESGVLRRAGATVLDFGSSEGSFFEALTEAGVEGRWYGIEPNPDFRAYAGARHGAQIYSALDELPPSLDAGLDLVVMIHVLEHLDDPVETLSRLRRLLAPGGRLYIDVPDASAYRSATDLHVAHIFHFSEATFARTLVEAGYEIVSLEAHAPLHHPRSIRAVATAATALASAASASAVQPPADTAPWARLRRIDRSRVRLAVKRWLRRLVPRRRRD